MGRRTSSLNYKLTIKEYVQVFLSSRALKFQCFMPPFICLIYAIVSSSIFPLRLVSFLPVILVTLLLTMLVCSFCIHNYLDAKYSEAAFSGDFKAFTQADMEKQRKAGYYRVFTLPITLKQSLILGLLMLIMFIPASIFFF